MPNQSIFKEQLSRRELGKIALGGALGATALGGLSQASSAQQEAGSAAASGPVDSLKVKWPLKGLSAQAPTWPLKGIHLSINAPSEPTDEDLLFFQDLAIDCVYVRGMTAEQETAEGLIKLKNRYADAGIFIDDVDNSSITANLDDIVLNNPGRDKAIEAYCDWVRTLAKAGYHQMESIMYGATGTVTSGEYAIRGGIRERSFDIDSNQISGSPWHVNGRGKIDSLLFGRVYTRDEIWANYEYFMKKFAPVVTESKIRVGLLGDSPALPGPNPSVFGVARIMSNPEDQKRVLEIANSPYIGMGGFFGQEAIDRLAQRGEGGGAGGRGSAKLAPGQLFVKGHWADEGNINQSVERLKEAAKIHPDGAHTIGGALEMVGGKRTYQAFAVAYTRAMLQMAGLGPGYTVEV